MKFRETFSSHYSLSSISQRLKNRNAKAVLLSFVVGMGLLLPYYFSPGGPPLGGVLKKAIAYAVAARSVTSPFLYTFNSNGVVEETGSMNDSGSPYFWVNSGGRFVIASTTGGTIQGPLPTGDKWQVLYGKNNPLDTGNGYYPQNLFRLVTRATWNNVSEETRFKMVKVNMTDTPNRDGYSGILLFSRYRDEYNLYYAGIRMDGTAVIKKKVTGTYTTLAQTQVFGTAGTYNKYTNPNLIPTGKWMRLKTVTQDQADGSVKVTLYLDKTDSGVYTQILQATDKTNNVKGPAYMGIRTDYSDVQFSSYKLTSL